MDKHRNANGTYNGVTLMAEMTGLPAEEISAIAEQVKANQAKLSSCAYHEFERLLTAPPGREAYGCKHCRGTVDAVRYRWHEQGRKPKPVPVPDWRENIVKHIEATSCSQHLRVAGKAYPRTCPVHGLTCGIDKKN